MLVFETQDSVQNYKLQIHQFDMEFNTPPQSFLSPEELDYLPHLHHAKRQNEYLQSRFALKTLISAKIGLPPPEIQFEKMGQGKPFLPSLAGKLDFNLSHSDGFFALALSEKGHVGVDIEKIRLPSHFHQIARKFFSKQEIDWILNSNDPQIQAHIFTKLWSGKEAVIKTLGGGVFKNVHEIQLDPQSWQLQNLPEEFHLSSEWKLHFYQEIQGFVCSLAFKAFVP